VFDAIEFDPLIATGDVLYDLAFLLMDLIERGLGAAANVVLNRYLAETKRPEDLDGLATLPLFLSLRAAIRAKVTAARVDLAASDDDGLAAAARSYFALALRQIAPPRPRLIAIGGLSGTGKSTLARALAPTLAPPPGAVLLRSDVERKSLFGVADTARLPPAAYGPDVTRRVYAALADKARRVVAAGQSAIVDAVFAQPDERAKAAAAARAAHVDFHGIFLIAGLDDRVARVQARRHDASDADAAVAREQESYDLGQLDWVEVDASGPLDATLAAAQAAIGSQNGTHAESDPGSHASREPAPR
jgi:hypothetical protein